MDIYNRPDQHGQYLVELQTRDKGRDQGRFVNWLVEDDRLLEKNR